jgi:hypothetical protein
MAASVAEERIAFEKIQKAFDQRGEEAARIERQAEEEKQAREEVEVSCFND